jgi:hypothetical protein
MVVDIEFERLVPEIDADRFAVVSEADGGVDRHRTAYSVEYVAC